MGSCGKKEGRKNETLFWRSYVTPLMGGWEERQGGATREGRARVTEMPVGYALPTPSGRRGPGHVTKSRASMRSPHHSWLPPVLHAKSHRGTKRAPPPTPPHPTPPQRTSPFSNQSLRCSAHSVCSLVAIRYLSSPSPGKKRKDLQVGACVGVQVVEQHSWSRSGQWRPAPAATTASVRTA